MAAGLCGDSELEASVRSPPWASNVSQGPGQPVPHRWPYWEAKLWWVLVASFFTLMTTLSIVLTVLWYHDHDRTLDEMGQVYKDAIGEFDRTVNEVTDEIVQRIQKQVVQRAQERVQEYMKIPMLIAVANGKSVSSGLRIFSSSNVSRNLQMLWMEMQEKTDHMSSVYYADSTGTYAGYQSVSNEGKRAMYRPPDAYLTSDLVCPVTCPPLSDLQPGEVGYWTADSVSGAFKQKLGSQELNPRTELWYQLAEQAAGRPSWTRPFAHGIGKDLAMDYVQGNMVGGRLDMVFGASISLRCLSSFLGSVHRSLVGIEAEDDDFGRAATFIVDQAGEMIASSRGFDQILTVYPNGTFRRRTWRELGGLSVRAALTQLNATGTSLPLPEDALPGLVSLVDFENGPYMCAYGTLKFENLDLPSAAINWIIVSVVRRRAYMRDVDECLGKASQQVAKNQKETDLRLAAETRRTAIFSAVLTLLGGALMACVARAITLPIRRISKEMHSMAQLKFIGGDLPEDDRDLVSRSMELVSFHNTGDTADGSSDDSSTDDSEEAKSVRNPRRCLPGFPAIAELVEMRDAFASMSSGLQSFAKYVDPHVVEVLVRARAEARLGVEQADVTVFFSDVANFTTMGERMEPEQFMNLLSEYLEEMSSIIMRHKGVVGEYIGDGIMAWWNTPCAIERHTVVALTAVLEQQQRLESLRHHWAASGLPEVRVRMGLSRGVVLAGNVGSRRRMKFGLVGDNVNLASRLESLCKRYGVYMLVDASVVNAPGVREAFLFRPLDLVVVKGRSGTTELFELVATIAEADSDTQSFVRDFTSLLALYRSGEIRAALSALEVYKTRWPRDKPTEILIGRCKALLAHPPGPGWSPVETLFEK